MPSWFHVLMEACLTDSPAMHTSPAWAYLGLTTWTTQTRERGGGGSLTWLCTLLPASAPPRQDTQERTGGPWTGAQQLCAELASGDTSECSANSPRREPSLRTIWSLTRSLAHLLRSLSGSQAWMPLRSDATEREDRGESNVKSRTLTSPETWLQICFSR